MASAGPLPPDPTRPGGAPHVPGAHTCSSNAMWGRTGHPVLRRLADDEPVALTGPLAPS